LDCKKTPYVHGQQGFGRRLGMAFVSDAKDAAKERLFVTDVKIFNWDDLGLATIDTSTFTLEFVAPYDKVQAAAELTGTGDARLFGFFASQPPSLAEIDVSDAHVISLTSLPTVDTGAAIAFAQWAGDFWLFSTPTPTGPDLPHSMVTRVRPKDASV